MNLLVRPLSPHIGAEVIGADLGQPLGDNLFRELHQAWVDADGLLVVRDQNLTPEQQIAFSRQFGDLAVAGDNPVIQKYSLPGHPEIFRVSNKKKDGEPLGREDRLFHRPAALGCSRVRPGIGDIAVGFVDTGLLDERDEPPHNTYDFLRHPRILLHVDRHKGDRRLASPACSLGEAPGDGDRCG